VTVPQVSPALRALSFGAISHWQQKGGSKAA